MTAQPARLAKLVVVLALAAVVSRADEGYRLEGTMHDEFPAIAGRVAILPPQAPGDLDSVWLDRRLAGQTDMRPKAPLVPLREVRAAVARLGIDPAAGASRGKLAAELAVDSFLEIRISDLGVSRLNEVGAPEGGMAIGKVEKRRAQAKVVVRIVSADSETLWFEGTTDGTQFAKGIQPIVADMLDKLFERAYPARRYR